jgi:hypothetical protein
VNDLVINLVHWLKTFDCGLRKQTKAKKTKNKISRGREIFFILPSTCQTTTELFIAIKLRKWIKLMAVIGVK